MAVNVRLKHSSVDAKAPVAADLLEGEIALNINENSPAAYIKDSAGQIVKLAGAGSVTDATNVKKAGDTMTGPLVLSGDPVADDQASNKKYVDDVAAAAVISGDAKYVEVTGDNMTGDLTLGDGTTDKITLDATAGGATFGGDVETEGTAGIWSGGRMIAGYNAPASTASNDTAYGITANSNFDRVNSNGTTNNTAAVWGQNFTDNGRVWCGLKGSNSQTTSEIFADGSATFTSNVNTNSFFWSQNTDSTNGGIYLYNHDGNDSRSDGAFYISPTNITSEHTVVINYDGSASFAGAITLGDGLAGTDGAYLYPGSLSVRGDSLTAANSAFAVYRNGATSDDQTCNITQGGSATFAGNVDALTLLAGTTVLTDTRAIQGSGYYNLYVQSLVDPSNPNSGLQIKASISNDGSAIFTSVNGSAFSINLEADDDTKYTSTTEEYEEQVEDTPFVPAIDAVVGPRGNVIKEEVPATEATYKTVTKTREVKTYSGPVLNVKDELQSLRARATQQDETIRLMTAALKSLGIDTAAFPAPEDEEPKTRSRKKK